MRLKDFNELPYLKKEITNYEEKLKELRAESQKITATLSAQPRARGVSDRVGEYAAEIADLERQINKMKIKATNKQNKLYKYIENVEDSQTRQILEYRFIEGLSWGKVAKKVGGGNTSDGVRKRAIRYIYKNQMHI